MCAVLANALKLSQSKYQHEEVPSAEADKNGTLTRSQHAARLPRGRLPACVP
jgi:hypothetical protein